MNKKNLWPLICEKMEYINKVSASALKNIYKSILYPYDIYVSKNSELVIIQSSVYKMITEDIWSLYLKKTN